MSAPLQPEDFERVAALRVEDFRDRIGEEFVVEPGVRFELIALHEREDAEERSFTLVFAEYEHPMQPQNTYVFEHPELGRLPLFVSPTGPGKAGGETYSAVLG